MFFDVFSSALLKNQTLTIQGFALNMFHTQVPSPSPLDRQPRNGGFLSQGVSQKVLIQFQKMVNEPSIYRGNPDDYGKPQMSSVQNISKSLCHSIVLVRLKGFLYLITKSSSIYEGEYHSLN